MKETTLVDITHAALLGEASQYTWGTADGRRLTVAELDDNHLRNVIFHLLKRYGLATSNLMEKAEDHLAGISARFPIFPVLLREATRRQLSWIP